MLNLQMQTRRTGMALLGTILSLGGAFCYGQASSPPSRKVTVQDTTTVPGTDHGAPRVETGNGISDQEACQRMKTLLPLAEQTVDDSGRTAKYVKITGARLTSTGYTLSLDKKPEISITYTDVLNVTYSTGHVWHYSNNGVAVQIPDHQSLLIFPKSDEASPFPIYLALKHLADAAHVGRHFDCTGNVLDPKADLENFAQKTAAWRAMTTKPDISEEVYKDRLLAEDALKNKNMASAASYYETGVASDPTWAQGWYNVALVYAELQKYSYAVESMKHYVILLPDAPDVRAAKDNIILWEAKAPRP